MKFQHPVKVGVKWNVVSLTLVVLEAKCEESVGESNAPSAQNLVSEGFVNIRHVGVNGSPMVKMARQFSHGLP